MSPPQPEETPDDAKRQADAVLTARIQRHTFRLVFGVIILIGIVGALIAADQLLSGDSELGALDNRRAERGERAPDFALRDLDGDVVRLSDFEGQPVWINFWASWCGPCREELPDIQALAERFEGDGLVVLAVNKGESESQARSFWNEMDLDLPALLDSDEEVADQYRLVGLPNNFFIDRDGVLRSLQLGFLTEEEMVEHLATIGIE